MWNTIVKLSLLSLVPISLSVIMRLVRMHTKFRKLPYMVQQSIIGVLFGIISMCASLNAFTVQTTSGAGINIRDVAPICAGFIFGAPAGIIAGIMGGLFRFFSVYAGISGAYTQFACSISTIMAGLITAFIRKVVFEGHHGRWYYGFGLGLLVESFHMLMVFFTHMNDIETAYEVVSNCASPMIIVNSLAVMVALIGVALVSKEPLINKTKPMKISSMVQFSLLGLLTVSFLAITFFTKASLTNIQKTNTKSLLTLNVNDVTNDVNNEINNIIEDVCYELKDPIKEELLNNNDSDSINSYLVDLATTYDVSEISIVNNDCKIVYSTNSNYINFDMSSGVQSAEFNTLLGVKQFYVQEYQNISLDSSVKMKYAGVKLRIVSKDIAYIQIGYNSTQYFAMLNDHIEDKVEYRHVGEDGYILIANEEGQILSKGNDLMSLDKETILNLKLNEVDTINIEVRDSKLTPTPTDMYYYAINLNGFYIVSFASVVSSNLDTNIAYMSTMLTSITIFLILYCVIYIITKKLVVDGVIHMEEKLGLISDGNLNVRVNERSSYEFLHLSTSINKTVTRLQVQAEREAKRIDDELTFAKNIQSSSLPNTFPAFPSIPNVDIHALMSTAKEVGGDFYDFYRIGNDKVAILIADVSGKGIPAAMFMMKAKATIKNFVKSGLEVNDALTESNKVLCEGNDAQMFVTAWLAYINVTNGHVEFANAGHNPPLVSHNGNFEYIKSRPGFVLAGLEDVIYKKNELDLNDNDYLYLYTDGVTEANNKNQNLYSEERLINHLNSLDHNITCFDLNKSVLSNVRKFTKGALQSDDITMLSFKFNKIKEEN